MSAADRFWSKVDKDGPNGCWVWTAAKVFGYGKFGAADKDIWWAHRWSYTQCVGPIPEGLQIDHLCRNRACVNPAHLEAVTQRENQRRGMGFAGVQSRRTHFPQGHLYEGDNLYVWRGQRHCLTCRHARGRRGAA